MGLGIGVDIGLGTGVDITGADTPKAAPVRVPVCCMMFAVLPLTNVYAVKCFVVLATMRLLRSTTLGVFKILHLFADLS